MKRTGFLFEKICDIDNIKLAIKNASKNKKNRRYVARIIAHSDQYAAKVQAILLSKKYDFGHSIKRIIRDTSSGKEREITVPHFFPDQIVHWAVMQVIAPVLTKGMYRYCCASVPKRGAIYAKKKVENALRNDKKLRYCMKLDIKKFFPTVNHDKLKELLRKKIKDKDTLYLLDCIIDTGGEGIPIGYYTSQWFSNFYLQEFDTFVKQDLKIRHYIRYADDMVMLDTNKRKLRNSLAAINKYFADNNYGIRIKDNWQIWKLDSRPIDFVGYRFYRDYTKLRKKIFYKLTKYVRKIGKDGINIHLARQYTSLIGWAKHINFKHYYQKNILPTISTGAVIHYVSKWEKKKIKEKSKWKQHYLLA